MGFWTEHFCMFKIQLYLTLICILAEFMSAPEPYWEYCINLWVWWVLWLFVSLLLLLSLLPHGKVLFVWTEESTSVGFFNNRQNSMKHMNSLSELSETHHGNNLPWSFSSRIDKVDSVWNSGSSKIIVLLEVKYSIAYCCPVHAQECTQCACSPFRFLLESENQAGFFLPLAERIVQWLSIWKICWVTHRR